MDADAHSGEQGRVNASLRSKHARMREQMLFYLQEVTGLPGGRRHAQLFHQALLRYGETPPPVDLAAGPRGAELLARSNGRLWVLNQAMSRDLRRLEGRFEDLVVQKTREAGTATDGDGAEERWERLQALEDDVKALKLKIRLLKQDKMKTEEEEEGLRRDTHALHQLRDALQRDNHAMDARIGGQLKTHVKNLTFGRQQQALRDQALELRRRKSQLEESLRGLEVWSSKVWLMWRRFFT